jgi:hypothetical protein
MLGKGYADTLAEVERIVTSHGYPTFSRVKDSDNNSGWITRHPNMDCLTIGLWIMPNNKDEGAFEDFIKLCLKSEDEALMRHAEQVVDQLPEKRFIPQNEKLHRVSKAQVGTWNAWQELPNDTIKPKHIDLNAAPMQSLIAWLEEVYKDS